MDTGFFKWVWRFNAIAIAGLVAFLSVVLVWEFADDLFRERRAPATVNVDPEDTTVDERLEIAVSRYNSTTGLFELAMLRPQTYDAGGFSSGPSKSTYDNVVNRGYLNPVSGDVRWLLDHSDGLIVGERLITREEEGDETHVATLFRWITKDTTGDRRLSASDAGTFFVVDPDGTRLTVLAEDIAAVSKSFDYNDTTQTVELTRDGARELAFVSLTGRQIERSLKLPEF